MTTGLIVVLSMACKLFFSFTFWLASFHKLSDLENFSAILGDYGVSERLPRKSIAALIALVECVLAALLLIPALAVFALQGMAAVLAIYMVALLFVYGSGKKLRDCGCGTRHQANQALTLWPAARNGMLIACMILIALFFPGETVEYVLYDWLVIVPMAAIFLLAYWTVEEMRSNRFLLIALQKFNG